MLPDLPEDWNRLEMIDKINRTKGPSSLGVGLAVPFNVFLRQELERLQNIITIVRTQLQQIIDAIEGTIIMTPEIVNAIDSIATL